MCFAGLYAGLVLEIGPQMSSRMIVFYDAYEPEVSELLKRIVRPGMVVYDVGAHVGIHALYMAKQLKRQGVVYAFEAWPDNYAVLERNVARNRGRVAEIVPVLGAVGDHGGVAGVSRGASDGQHHLTQTGERVDHEVQSITLDGFCRDHEQQPAVILMDVEGRELDALRGAKQLLENYHPKLILEHHGPERAARLVDWLFSMHYQVERLGGRHLYAE